MPSTSNIPRPPRTTYCKSCGEPIFFAETRNGRRVPLDQEERPDGNIVLETDQGGAVVAVYLHEDEAGRYTGPRYVSHFATCEDAATFRRPKR